MKIQDFVFHKNYRKIPNIFNKYHGFFRKSHPFFIVSPSFWPSQIALGVLFLTLGLVKYFHFGSSFYFWLGFFVIMLGTFFWIKDLRYEFFSLKILTSIVQLNVLTGMVLFIVSEIMIFFGFFWAFFHSSLSPSIFIGGVWPPLGIDPLNPYKWPFVNTYILLLSGMMVNIFYYIFKSFPGKFAYSMYFTKDFLVKYNGLAGPHWLEKKINNSNVFIFYFFFQDLSSFFEFREFFSGKKPGSMRNFSLFYFLIYIYSKFKLSINSLHYTLLLGFLFERIQWFEYLHASFSITDGIYGTTFFLLTGLHGFHVMLGIILLLYCNWSFYFDFYFSWWPHIRLSASIWYWHFVDIVWLFVFFFVLLFVFFFVYLWAF